MMVHKMLPAENMRKWFDLLGTVIGQEKKDSRGELTKWLAKHFPSMKWFEAKWRHFVVVKFDEEFFERADELGLTRYQHWDTEKRIRSEGYFLVEESELATYVEGLMVKVSLGVVDSVSQYFTGALPIRFKLKVLQSSDEVEEVRRAFSRKSTLPGVVEDVINHLKGRENRRREIERSDALASEELAKSVATLFVETKVVQVMELLSLTNERIHLGAYRDEKNTCWYVYAYASSLVEVEDEGRIPFVSGSDRLSRVPIERAVSYEDFAKRAVRTRLGDVASLRRKILDEGHTVALRFQKKTRTRKYGLRASNTDGW